MVNNPFACCFVSLAYLSVYNFNFPCKIRQTRQDNTHIFTEQQKLARWNHIDSFFTFYSVTYFFPWELLFRFHHPSMLSVSSAPHPSSITEDPSRHQKSKNQNWTRIPRVSQSA